MVNVKKLIKETEVNESATVEAMRTEVYNFLHTHKFVGNGMSCREFPSIALDFVVNYVLDCAGTCNLKEKDAIVLWAEMGVSTDVVTDSGVFGEIIRHNVDAKFWTEMPVSRNDDGVLLKDLDINRKRNVDVYIVNHYALERNAEQRMQILCDALRSEGYDTVFMVTPFQRERNKAVVDTLSKYSNLLTGMSKLYLFEE